MAELPTGTQETLDLLCEGVFTRHCPLTLGKELRITKAGFAVACKRKQENTVHYKISYTTKNRRHGGLCALCKGKRVPKEVHFLTATEMRQMAAEHTNPSKRNGEETMGSKKVRGKCEGGCEEMQMLATNYGVMMCTTCGNVHANVRNRAETVVGAIHRTGKLEWYLGQLVGENQTVAVTLENDFLRQVAAEVGYEGTDPTELLAAIKAKNNLIEAYSQKQRTHSASELELQHIADSVAWPGKESGPLATWIETLLYSGRESTKTLALIQDRLGIEGTGFDIAETVGQLIQALDQYRSRCEELEAKEREPTQLAAYHEQVLVAVRDALGSPLIPLAETAYRVEVLQQELEQLRDGVASIPGADINRTSALDSHLLDLLIDYPAISLDRIATIREAV